jgi:uncharacterized membrane protein YdjX (TVP38/TMEM64 family)
MFKIIIVSWFLLAIINLLYEFGTNVFEKTINNIHKETNDWFSKEFIILLYFIVGFMFSPFIFFSETIPDMFIDVMNFPRFIRYKRILRKRKQRNI